MTTVRKNGARRLRSGAWAGAAACLCAAVLLQTTMAKCDERTRTGRAKDVFKGQAVNGQTATPVEQAIKRLADLSGGIVGVSAIHVETGRHVSFNSGMRFPMASSYKFPIALQLLHRVDRGEVRLGDTVLLNPHDFRPGHSPLVEFANNTALTLTVKRLLELMVGQSDNTASDTLLRIAGGASAVTARMRQLGIEDIDVNRTETELAAALNGVYELPPESEWSLELFDKIFAQNAGADSKAITEKFLNDPRDTATPDAMVELLLRVHKGEALSLPSSHLLLQLMTTTTTGEARLKGLLPPRTPVAHKTGTWGSAGTTNDVGLIKLPDKAGHIAIAILIKASTKDVPERERAIAEIARTIYDNFMLCRE